MKWMGLLLVVVAIPAWAGFDYFENSWAVIGLKDYERGTRITPDNALMIGASAGTSEREAEKASVRIRFGKDLKPLSREQTKESLDGWLPVYLLEARDGTVTYTFTMWASPLPSVKNWEAAYDWPTEGENFLNWVKVRAVNSGEGECEAKVRFECSEPSPGLPREFAWTLPGKGSAEGFVAIPWAPVEGADFSGEDGNVWLERTADYWRGVMAHAASIRVPCEKASQAYLAAHVCQLIANDHGEMHGGEGFYDEFYIRDGAYQIMELEEAGLSDAAAKAIESYLQHQRDDGRFESQKDQFDANGQAQWALLQYYQTTGDRAWLERAYPQMRKAAFWTIEARKASAADSPFAGLLPNAPADGESLWDGKHHIVGYDFWNLRGMLCTAEAARVLGQEQDRQAILDDAAAYHVAIDKAWQRTGLAYFPPSWEKEGTYWGGTETLWPTPIFDPDDARVVALEREVREHYMGGFVEGTIRWTDGKMKTAIHPYMSAYTTMASLARGEDAKVVDEFYWYLLHSSATHGFPEGIFYDRRFAWSNTIPHVTGASNYAVMLRHMLVHEQDGTLHLLKAVPDWWLDAGNEIAVDRLPTHFGPMSLRIQGSAQGVSVRLEAPVRQAPARIVLHLPTTRLLESAVPGVDVAYREPQAKRYDFAGVVAEYAAH